MANSNTHAPDSAYRIICPYCFNQANGGTGEPFPHTEVHFRSTSYFSSIHDVEAQVGIREMDFNMNIGTEAQLKQFASLKRFVIGPDERYQDFWRAYEGTTEQAGSATVISKPWELPVIHYGNGAKTLKADSDGFVTGAVDDLGRETFNRVCPYCHNPLPLGYGKNPVKYISIIGITGSGKTVYISQLLKGMSEYASKAALSAYFTSDHERNFIAMNQVKEGVQLPASTSPKRLSQPMFYDIVREEKTGKRTDTIVLYDIAGENCRKPDDMKTFARFVEHADGIILLIDPKQLGFLPTEIGEEEADLPSLALNTLHSILDAEQGKKSTVPIAVCVSKSDQCTGILPPIAQESVQSSDLDPVTGLPTREFDGRTYNMLTQGDKGLTGLMKSNARQVCQNLISGYVDYNFFAVSATGCPCEMTDAGFLSPIHKPTPRRIEEPILWLFKHFGFIRSNTYVCRPFRIQQPARYRYKKPPLGKARLEICPVDYSVYEEEPVRADELVCVKDVWVRMNENYRHLPKVNGKE